MLVPHAVRIIALSSGLALLAGAVPASAWAAPESEPSAAPSEADPEGIFRRGQAKYETADYNGAIELWTEAYALVDSTPENASIKALLIYNLAQAHSKAYEIDGDPIHLKQAQQLLRSFEANLELLYDDAAQLQDERAKVQARLAEIDGEIAALEQAEPEPEPEPKPEPVPPPIQDQPEPEPKSGTPLVIAGSVVTGVGALAGVGAIVGGLIASSSNDISDLERDDLQAREDRFASGRTGNAMLLAGSIGAGVLLPTGVALLVVGVLRNKQAKRSAAATLPMLTPTFGRGSAGLSVTGRF